MAKIRYIRRDDLAIDGANASSGSESFGDPGVDLRRRPDGRGKIRYVPSCTMRQNYGSAPMTAISGAYPEIPQG